MRAGSMSTEMNTMRGLRHWSFSKLALLSIGWVVLSVSLFAGLFLGWLYSIGVFDRSGGIGAVSAGILPLVAILVSIGPVVALLFVWVWQKLLNRE